MKPTMLPCTHEYRVGIAMVNGYSGYQDFIGNPGVCTMSVDPTRFKIIPAMKCLHCGFSLSWPELANPDEL